VKKVLYSQIRDQIQGGDVIALHDKFVASWYGLKIQAVQLLTGPYCHVGLIWPMGGRVWCLESVIPKIRMSPLSNVAGEGFFWLPIAKPMSEAEIEFALSQVSVGEYSQAEAIEAGLGTLTEEDALNGRWECAKYTVLARRLSGVELGPDWVPTKVVGQALARFHVEPIWVDMDMPALKGAAA
jgi:hypothetical protein